MRRKVLFFIALMTLFMATACNSNAWAIGPKIELDGRYWITSISGNVQVSGSGLAPTDVDLKSDLNVSNSDVPDVRLIWHTGDKSWIRLSYTYLHYDGNTSLPRSVNFNGRTYTVSDRVASDLTINYASLGWAWQFINIADVVKFGTLISAKGLWTDASLNDQTMGVSESKNFAFGLPTVGAALDITPPLIPIDLFGEFSWMTAGKYGRLYNTEAGLKIKPPIPFLSIIGGYRIFDMTAKDDPDFAHVKIEGPFAGATLAF
ncbi:MAG: hypothetical protein M0Z58_06180 [Nitrospiraceae bacterium]|nr:hypothetical protein [Nitrospiraceae bacterium]